MEVHSLHQITQPLRLERGQAGITDLAVNIHKRVKMSNMQYCHYLPDFTGARGRKSNQNITLTPYLATAVGSYNTERTTHDFT